MISSCLGFRLHSQRVRARMNRSRYIRPAHLERRSAKVDRPRLSSGELFGCAPEDSLAIYRNGLTPVPWNHSAEGALLPTFQRTRPRVRCVGLPRRSAAPSARQGGDN
jgi:hypothetical protein